MKVLIFTDNHFCENSSIIHSIGQKYSTRLENQLMTLNWLENLASEESCDAVFCAGDFFDKPNLTDTELTAVKDIKWNYLPHYFLVGNHESSVNGLRYNSTKALEGTNRQIISSPTSIMFNKTEVCFLPYIIESDRKQIEEYFKPKSTKRLILSHNDIYGIQMGPIMSKTGFHTDELEKNADLVVNGHLHNGQKISSKIVNLGNVTGQNFSEDAQRYLHNVMILDLDTLTYKLIENPYALNFYKIEIKSEYDFKTLETLKPNAVLSVNCNETCLDNCKKLLDQCVIANNVIAYRLIVVRNSVAADAMSELSKVSFSVNHIAKFIDCARSNLASSKLLEEELAEVCK